MLQSHTNFVEFERLLAGDLGSFVRGYPLSSRRIKNKERPLGEVKWAGHWKSRGTWAGPCDHLDTWVGLSFLELLAIAVQTANAQKTEVGGAGHVNARHGWSWT